MQVPNKATHLFTLLCFPSNNMVAVASEPPGDVSKSTTGNPETSATLTETIRPPTLYAEAKQFDTSALSQYASLGFLCVREGGNELPAKVTNVTTNGLAYKLGLQVTDRILGVKCNIDKIVMSIDRNGKRYTLKLPSENLDCSNNSNPKMLYGKVNKLDVSALSQYSSFGFLCARTGKTELPASVTNVIVSSTAYWQGLKVNDRVIQLHADSNRIMLDIERDGKNFAVILPQHHPFKEAGIARDCYDAVVQKEYGDCWFDATTVALASTPRGQTLIKNMITQVSPTSYLVTFPGEPNTTWPVNLNTIQHYHLKNRTLWAQLIEAAALLHYESPQKK